MQAECPVTPQITLEMKEKKKGSIKEEHYYIIGKLLELSEVHVDKPQCFKENVLWRGETKNERFLVNNISFLRKEQQPHCET